MNSRFWMMILGTIAISALVLFFFYRYLSSLSTPLAGSGSNESVSEEELTENQEQYPVENKDDQPVVMSLKTPVPDEIPFESFVKRWHFNRYQAVAADDLSVCADDEICLKHAKRIKSWVCAATVCGGADTTKKPVDCFEEFREEYAPEMQEQINLAICPVIQSSSPETREALLTKIPGSTEDKLMEYGAYLLALKGSAESCENYIKKYVGPFDNGRWNLEWYRALSGCRILARERTREQEEKDFYYWRGVSRAKGDPCIEIVNSDLRNACATPGSQNF